MKRSVFKWFMIPTVFALALMAAGNVMAKKPVKPGGTISEQNTEAWWTGSLASDPRDCWTGWLSARQGGVRNGCDISATSPVVFVDFDPMYIVSSGKNPGLCALLSMAPVFGDRDDPVNPNDLTGFGFSAGPEWNDTACLQDLGDTCRIRTQIWAYGYICLDDELVGGECPGERLITMEAFGPAVAADSPELNPFTIEQHIAMNEQSK